MIDFAIEPEVAALAERVRAFVADTVIPREAEDAGDGHGLDDDLRRELQDAARAAGLLTPQAPVDEGGHGLDHRGQAVIFEEAGYSLLGPQALNCAAPDEGNMHLLRLVATAAQQERYLAPGAGRDALLLRDDGARAGGRLRPAMLRTTARRDGDDWVLDGTSGSSPARSARRSRSAWPAPATPSSATEGATMFLVDAGTPGFERAPVEPIDRSFPGGHAEVRFADCRVPADAVLGEDGLGYRYAQVRLAPARLTHCMRWLGLARRSLDIALDRAREREAFGQRLEELGMVQAMIADSVLDLDASRLMIQRCAWELDQGGAARGSSSAAKVLVGEAVGRVVDRAVQICGSLGVSRGSAARPLPRRGARRSASTTAPPRRTAGRSPAAPPATARGPSAGPEVAAPAAVEIVDTPEQAADLALAPLLVRRPLEAFLDAHGLGRGPLAAQRIGAGSSNVTYLVERDGARVVLRRPPRPPLPPSAHDVLREARLLRALAGTPVRVPAVLATCDDPAVLGVPFYVMPVVEGEALTERLPPALDAPTERRASRTSSSMRWWRCTPSTWTRSGSPTSAARRATWSARSAASRGSGR